MNEATQNDGNAIESTFGNNFMGDIQASTTTVLTGLNAGSNTFAMQYKVLGAGTTTFSYRTITVIQLG